MGQIRDGGGANEGWGLGTRGVGVTHIGMKHIGI